MTRPLPLSPDAAERERMARDRMCLPVERDERSLPPIYMQVRIVTREDIRAMSADDLRTLKDTPK